MIFFHSKFNKVKQYPKRIIKKKLTREHYTLTRIRSLKKWLSLVDKKAKLGSEVAFA